MKKVLFLFVALISLNAMGQITLSETSSTTREKNMFVGLNLSMSQGEFSTSSYGGLEVGYMPDNIAYSAIIGRGDFKGMFRKGDNLNNYWWEVKFSPSYDLGRLNGFLIAGGGAYFNSDHYFAELGFGVSYTSNNINYGVCFSNWDTKNYVTPFVSINF